ncbi:acyl-CoA dehydrogenase family protein [Alkalicoccus urumqiensis]|uniref:Isovaleryl-CoA dehydrogenase n=1 Tax=Alkalicoccus urumqiensis TaxID=1548213 RepID=A0A2P6MJU2_ALKUR|nr:acyl-CoA dehydrogenase family protein [Alkalicoccus urumqiensis]PRO66541.1 isovaleryl-CoA dehydrogenase [Alkalicoccus urumqiensis]
MNWYKEDELIQELVRELLPESVHAFADDQLERLGAYTAGPVDERAAFTDRAGEPKLERYDKYGRQVSRVHVNEGYEKTAQDIYGAGIVRYIHKKPEGEQEVPGYLYSFFQGYLVSQAEAGFYCPVTLSMAAAYLLEAYGSPEQKDSWLTPMLSLRNTWEGATFLTERQGGSDVGANTTEALQTEDGSYRLYGEKYFASNAGRADVMMVLARTPDAPDGTKGLSLFLVPKKQEDEERIVIRRLKDKLGVRAVPSGEVEFDGAEGFLVGEEFRGFAYMVEALNLSRICNAVASIGISRRALREMRTYAEERMAFGGPLISYPMIQDTLVRLKVKLEAETRAVFSLGRLFAGWTETGEGSGYLRLMAALLKEETADQAVHFAAEAMEMLGGNGYIEDFVTPRLLRDAQVLPLWEGSRNVLALEVLRLMEMDVPGTVLAGISAAPLQPYVQKLLEKEKEIQAMSREEKTRHIKPWMKQMVSVLEAEELFRAGRHQAGMTLIKSELQERFGEGIGHWTLEEGRDLL